MESTTVLVVDDDAITQAHLVEVLEAAGIRCAVANSGVAAMAWLADKEPALILLDLVMPDADGLKVLGYVRKLARFEGVPVVVVTAEHGEESLQRVIAAGADDYVRKPFSTVEVLARVKGLLRSREYLNRIKRREAAQKSILGLSQVLASTPDVSTALGSVVHQLAGLLRVERASIVLFGEGQVGHVVASNDDPEIVDRTISLSDYPELQEVRETRFPLVLADTHTHALLRPVRDKGRPLPFRSSALFPLLFEREALGAIFLRATSLTTFDDFELSLASTIANATAIALRNARTVQSLKDATQHSTNARAEAERRVQLFQRYADFFESSADGILVIARNGQLLFTNPRAREITGFSETRLVGMTLSELFTPNNEERAERLLKGFSQGVYPRAVDVTIRTERAESMIVNASFSSVMHEDNAILLSFRDVTQERRTAIELKQTKEFLERVIDSSVDGIVSADLNGTVLLFNRAAERLFQYSSSDVVGKLQVEQLYPEGVARQIMRNIRNPELNGYGRLEGHRVDMVRADGEAVPVVLSASLVLENGKPIGSVGIFTDIRERLRMEESLERAEEELRTREKHAILAELAGAAAHELNQPLTSVIGYGELLRRHLEGDEKLSNAANIIISEAERMAEIVRKVGKITRYETKSYVGSAKILDLEKASDS
ncbi:MAG: PAS domain S-box protein [Polyangiaceae bacterium]|nr:PAS domain S-box protein [Polyangiaceae bacterium]